MSQRESQKELPTHGIGVFARIDIPKDNLILKTDNSHEVTADNRSQKNLLMNTPSQAALNEIFNERHFKSRESAR